MLLTRKQEKKTFELFSTIEQGEIHQVFQERVDPITPRLRYDVSMLAVFKSVCDKCTVPT